MGSATAEFHRVGILLAFIQDIFDKITDVVLAQERV